MELGARLQGAWLAERAVEVVVVVVWGSDRVDPDSGYWRSADPLGFVHLVVGRDGQMARLREKRRADAAVGGGGGAAGGRRSRWEAAVLCELGGKGDGVGDMSSTRLRAMLAAVHVADGRAAKEAAGDAIVRAGFMTAEQLRYVLEHEDDLYFVAPPPAARTQATAVGSNAGSRGFGSGSVVGGGADDYDDPRSFFRDRRGGRNGREMLARRAAAAAVAVAVFAAVAAWAFSRG
ncbi:hypothetical protein DFJ73DRAFT_861744 [Zopfochytrium polystomum]|nr:hypothetical protein DFJ73DRAFT_861744 [Zopfochytrium polystomum]